MQANASTQSWMYETMFKSRYFEECMEKAYLEEKQPVFIGRCGMPGMKWVGLLLRECIFIGLKQEAMGSDPSSIQKN